MEVGEGREAAAAAGGWILHSSLPVLPPRQKTRFPSVSRGTQIGKSIYWTWAIIANAGAGWMNPFSEIISHPNFLHISEAKKPVVNPRYHRGIWNSGSWRQSRPR